MLAHGSILLLGVLLASEATRGEPAAAEGLGAALQPESSRTVRVELFEAPGPTRVAGHWIAPARRGLFLDGRRLGHRLHIPGPGPHETETHTVRGSLEIWRTGGGVQVINRVALEDYVVATVGGEI